MPSIAEAYVELHVDGDNLEGEVRSSVRDSGKGAEKDADKVGRSLGSRLGAGFLTGFGAKVKASGSKISRDVSKALGGLKTSGLGITALAAAIPVLTSAVGALGGVLAALSGSLLRAGASAASLVGVMGSLIQAKLVAKLAFSGLTEAIKGTEGAMAKLSPNGRELVNTLKALAPTWQAFRNAVQNTALAGVSDILRRLAENVLPKLQPAIVGTARHLNLMFKDLAKFVESASFVRRFGAALQFNNAIFGVLRQVAVPLLNGLLNLFSALQPSALRLADLILSVVRRFSAWSGEVGRAQKIDDFMVKAAESMGHLWRFTKNLTAALGRMFLVGANQGDGLLKTLGDMSVRFNNFTKSAAGQNKIRGFIDSSIVAFRAFGQVLGSLGGLFKAAFNPKLFGTVSTMFNQMLPTIKSVLQTIGDFAGPVFASIGEAVAEHGPKIAGLFKALAPLLKGVGAVISQVIKQAFDIVGTIAAVLTPVVGFISKVVGPVLEKLAPIIAALLLSFGGGVGIIAKFFGAFSKIPIIGGLFGVLGKIIVTVVGGAMRVLAAAGPVLNGLLKTVAFVFKGIWTVVRTVLGVVVGAVRGGFNLIRAVITGVLNGVRAVFSAAWRAMGGTVNLVVQAIFTAVKFYFGAVKAFIGGWVSLIRTIFTVVWSFIRGVFTKGGAAIGGVVTRVFGGIFKVVSSVMGRVRGFISTAWSAIVGTIGRFMARALDSVISGFGRVLDFIKKIPGKIVAVAAAFLNAGKDLGGKVIDGIGKGLSAAGGFISDIGASVKRAINSALRLPVHIKGPGPLPDFTIPAFARGTLSAPGGVALVGERGAELVDLPRGSRVHSAQQTRRLAADVAPASGGEVKVVQNYYGPTTSNGRLREIEWTLRYATGARRTATAGMATT